jgi:hypothetical protein
MWFHVLGVLHLFHVSIFVQFFPNYQILFFLVFSWIEPCFKRKKGITVALLWTRGEICISLVPKLGLPQSWVRCEQSELSGTLDSGAVDVCTHRTCSGATPQCDDDMTTGLLQSYQLMTIWGVTARWKQQKILSLWLTLGWPCQVLTSKADHSKIGCPHEKCIFGLGLVAVCVWSVPDLSRSERKHRMTTLGSWGLFDVF